MECFDGGSPKHNQLGGLLPFFKCAKNTVRYLPQNTAGFGDITKIDAVYAKNEVTPVRELLLEVNDHLPQALQVKFVEDVPELRE